MDAQKMWRVWYASAKRDWYDKDQCRYEMRKIRREAALTQERNDAIREAWRGRMMYGG